MKTALGAPEAERAWLLLELLAPRQSLDILDRLTVEYLRLIFAAWEQWSEITIVELFGVVSIMAVPKQRQALAADLINKGMRLRYFPSEDHNWSDLTAVIKHLDVHSALYGVIYPDRAGWDKQNMLLANIADSLVWLQWAQTKDGKKGRNRPKPIPRPGVVDEQPKGARVKATPLSQLKAKMARRYADNAALDAPNKLTAGLGRRIPSQQPIDRNQALAAAFSGRR